MMSVLTMAAPGSNFEVKKNDEVVGIDGPGGHILPRHDEVGDFDGTGSQTLCQQVIKLWVLNASAVRF